MKKNIILTDWSLNEDWKFKDLLNEYTDFKWIALGINICGGQNCHIKKIINVYLKYFIFSLNIFLNRKKYKNIIAWQQFLGLIFAFYCKVFKVKIFPKLYIMTFIYKPKKGLVGKIYFKFIESTLNSKYIEKVICFSKYEIQYYSNLFNVQVEKFDYCIYGIDSEINSFSNKDIVRDTTNNKYFLSVGRSNRDYEFLINSLENSKYNIVILCDELKNLKKNNIEIYNNIFGENYLSYLKKCTAVVITLKDENISSGQLVFLKAMELGKPVIITKSNTINEYIIDGYNGLIINKDKNSLLEAMSKLLTNSKYYNEISNNALDYYKERFSFDSFVKSIANIIINTNN